MFRVFTSHNNNQIQSPNIMTIMQYSCSNLKHSVRTALFNPLTFNDTYKGRTAPLTPKVAFYIFIQQIQVLNILNIVHTLRFFPSKCSLFHNSKISFSYIIHILYTGCVKIQKNNSGAKWLMKHARTHFMSPWHNIL
jgi:hypothetical protein